MMELPFRGAGAAYLLGGGSPLPVLMLGPMKHDRASRSQLVRTNRLQLVRTRCQAVSRSGFLNSRSCDTSREPRSSTSR